MKGYKVFNPDWTCRDFQYEVGKTYEMEGEPSCCDRGFHFCTDLKDCFGYHKFAPDNKVAIIEALGAIDTEGNKSCTNKITIVKEITWEEVLHLVNTGKGCSGLGNSGDYNSGDYNSGYYIKGFFKDTCAALRKVKGSASEKITAFKKIIDGNVFVMERKIPFQNYKRVGECQRPLRAQTPQGERVALAHSETVPAGAFIECTVCWWDVAKIDIEEAVREWLDFGEWRGLGQWRNSGKGRFTWEEIE